jgi:hypothetical protein
MQYGKFYKRFRGNCYLHHQDDDRSRRLSAIFHTRRPEILKSHMEYNPIPEVESLSAGLEIPHFLWD